MATVRPRLRCRELGALFEAEFEIRLLETRFFERSRTVGRIANGACCRCLECEGDKDQADRQNVDYLSHTGMILQRTSIHSVKFINVCDHGQVKKLSTRRFHSDWERCKHFASVDRPVDRNWSMEPAHWPELDKPITPLNAS